MLEKMRFEKKEKMKYRFYCWLCVAIVVVLYIGNLWVLTYVDVTKTLEAINTVLSIEVAIVTEIIVAIVILVHADEKMRENIENIEFNAKVDEFLKYLGTTGIVKVRSKIELPDLWALEKEFIKRQKIYYVRKMGSDSIYIWRENKNGEEKWSAECSDYEFFFKYFEPIYDFYKE